MAISTLVTKKKSEKSSDTIIREQVIILGNGPSLNEFDFSKIERERYTIVCVNDFPYKHQLFWEIKPEFIALFDPAYFEEKSAFQENREKIIDVIREINWPVTIITFQKQTLPISNRFVSYAWIARHEFGGSDCLKYRHYLYSHNLVNCGIQNVMVGATFFFLIKKVKKIYLAGLDMSEFAYLMVDDKNETWVIAKHSYGIEKISYNNAEIIKKGEFYKLLGYYCKMFTQFYYLSLFADYQNVKVYNTSINSYVDVFEKVYCFLKEEGEENR